MSDTPRTDALFKSVAEPNDTQWMVDACVLARQLERDLAAETEIVNRIWAIYGSPSYEELQGRSIYDLINADRADLAAANARMRVAHDELMNLQPHIAELPKQYQPFIDSHVDVAMIALDFDAALAAREKP